MTKTGTQEQQAERPPQSREKGWLRAISTVVLIVLFALFCVFKFAVLYYMFPVYILMSLFYLCLMVYGGIRKCKQRNRTPARILDDLDKGKLSPEQAERELKRCHRIS